MKLQELIETNITLSRVTNTGFHPVACAACNDHSERAGFKFEDGHVGYHCFNCKRRFVYTEGETLISNSAIFILGAFGISRERVLNTVNANFFETGTITLQQLTRFKKEDGLHLSPVDISLPKNSFFVGSGKHKSLEEPIKDYLHSRNINYADVKAMYSLSERHQNRVILPIYKSGKLIHWQSRAIDNTKPRYLTAHDNKQIAMWGLNNAYKHNGPLYVTEGIFDASFIDGVAILGSDLSPEKKYMLDNISRAKVLVVDSDQNGGKLAQVALQTGWDITFLPEKLDVNKSVNKYGLFYTIYMLQQNITTATASGIKVDGIDFGAMLALGLKMI